MNNYYYIWASFFILCCHLSTGSAYSPNVCTRLNHRPYIEHVPGNSFSSYIRRYQNQQQNVQKGGYIWETQYFCCAGYEGSTDDCRPICEAGCGSHSSCVAPGECQCDEGYSWNNNSCQAICTQACPEHSSCQQPEQCVCDTGYTQKDPANDSTSNTICKPNCSRGCGNGTCIEPEVCQCSAGLILVEDECVVDIRLTTDVVATSAMPAELITSCTDNCSCWQELSDWDIDDVAIKCVNICMDDDDQPCLELNRCHCDNQSSLICGMEKLQQRFICKIFNQLSPAINSNQSAPEVAALNSSENASSSDDWQAVLIASCIGLVFIALLVVLVRACIKGNRCTRIAVTSTLIILKLVAIAIRNANSKRTIDNPVFQPEINPYFNKQYKFH